MNRKPEQDVVEAIDMTLLCQALHCLPRAGGLMDQDYWDVIRMKWVIEAQAERENNPHKK
jgi:hypothetical protein